MGVAKKTRKFATVSFQALIDKNTDLKTDSITGQARHRQTRCQAKGEQGQGRYWQCEEEGRRFPRGGSRDVSVTPSGASPLMGHHH
jgi:hypothetical protein